MTLAGFYQNRRRFVLSNALSVHASLAFHEGNFPNLTSIIMNVLDGSVGFLLARTARSMKRALESRLSAYNITASQYVVLAQLSDEDGISLSQLGERLYFDSPTITGVVDRMERDQLVERRRVADDRRVISVFLTHKGKKLLSAIENVADEINEKAMDEFTKADTEKLLKSLDSIWRKMNGKYAR